MSGGIIMGIIDTHAHLDEMENIELELALDKARKAGIEAIIAVGSNKSSNQKVLEICRLYSFFVYPALGLHPWELGDLSESQIDDTLKLIEGKISDIIAIGEIGLDYDKRAIKKASKEFQKEVLKSLLALAKKHNKPVSIHSRYAWKDCFDIVNSTGIKKVVFHWFTGFSNVLRDILDAGYFISCTPAAEYHEEHRRAIKETPAEQLLLETDCPVVYGKEDRYRSQPSDALRSLKYAALLKEMSETAIAEKTTYNARQIFDIKLPSPVK
jgi:TatD DNase family protein